MKHVPKGREENSQGCAHRLMKEKSIANRRQMEKFVSIVRAVGKDASENSMRIVKVEQLVLNVRVGASGDRSALAEKESQQAERKIQSHRKSRKSGRRGRTSPDDDEVISTLRKAIQVSRKRTIKGGDRFDELW